MPLFDQLNNLNVNVFEFSKKDKYFLPEFINKGFYEEQIDLLLYKNHYCLLTKIQNFCRNKENTHTYFENV